MNYARAKRAAEIRNMYLGPKAWLNNMVGYGYSVLTPYGGLYMANTLDDIYKAIIKQPKVRRA